MDDDSIPTPVPKGRRRNRHGKLRQGQWFISRIRFRDPGTGKWREERRQFIDKATRDAHHAKRRGEQVSGTFIPPSHLTVGEMLEQWLRAKQIGKRATARTVSEYERYVRLYLMPMIGAVRLDDSVGIVHAVEAMVNAWSLRSPTGALGSAHYHALDILRMAFHWAVTKRELIARNPLTRMDLPRLASEPTTDSPWDLETIGVFLAEAECNPRYNRHYSVYVAALMLGMRQGEIFGLEWPHVDRVDGLINVKQTYFRMGARPIFKPPKTKAGRRSIPMNDLLFEGLTEIRLAQEHAKEKLGKDYGIPDHDLVFCHPNGKPIDGRAFVRRKFYGLCDAAGVPRVTFHHLRHLWMTYFERAGGNRKDAQALAGHATPDMAMRIYQHPVTDAQRAAIQRLTDLFLKRKREDT
jgi:integrase